MTTPHVSILLSVHNGAHTLHRCLTSIYEQTFQDFEIVCVNDGSTDATAEILDTWQVTFGSEKMRILTNESSIGLTRSLNRGLDIIAGTYTARIDADDFWHKEKLEKQAYFLKTHPDYGIIGCNYTNVSSDRQVNISLKETDAEIRQSIIKRNPFAHSCVIFRTELIRTLGKYNEHIRYGQDYDLWLRCLPKTKFYNLPEFLCTRSIDQGISLEKQREQMWQSIKTQVKYIRKYHYSFANYFFLLEPLIVIMSPTCIKNVKRKIW